MYMSGVADLSVFKSCLKKLPLTENPSLLDKEENKEYTDIEFIPQIYKMSHRYDTCAQEYQMIASM